MIRTVRALAIAVAAMVFAALGQAIVVAPHHVFIQHGTGSAVLYLFNPGDQAEEASVSLVFGYPESDSAGNVSIRFIENPDSADPSAAAWVRAFPRRMVVDPGQSRAVRLLAQPPSDLADGEYWARLIVASRGGQVPVTSPDTGVRVGVTLEVRTVVPVTYRKGNVQTGVEVTTFEPVVRDDSLVVWVGMRRLGTAAFLGTLRLALRDSSGIVVAESDRQVAVYYELLRRAGFAVDALPAGAYTVELRLSTERADLDPRDVLPAQPVEARVGVRVP